MAMATQNPMNTALIIGGSRGIGHATAILLAQEGYDIAFTYNSCEEAAAETAREIEAMGRRCVYFQADMGEKDVPAATVERAAAALGRIDALVVVAGITRLFSLLEMTPEKIDEIYNCNYKAVLLSASAAAKYMVANGVRGSIVLIGSVRGLLGFPNDHVYGPLKAALAHTTESAAIELGGYGIRVNCVAPGMTNVRRPDTPENLCREWAPQIPLGRFGMAGDVAAAIAFLVSDEARYITGVTIKVDGGMSLPAKMG